MIIIGHFSIFGDLVEIWLISDNKHIYSGVE